MSLQRIKIRIEESISTKYRILSDVDRLNLIPKAADVVASAISSGGKVLLCGNGGSASDALHLAGELVGRLEQERKAMPAIALNADVASMTAVSNDYGYEKVFERGVEGLLNKGDTLIGISTSGNSENVYLAVKKAKEMGGKNDSTSW